MSKFSLIITVLGFLAIFSLSSCGSGGGSNDENSDTTISQLEEKMDNIESTDSTKTNQLGKEYTAKYVCPMHCKGSGDDKAGKCAECDMDMIENPNNKK